MADIVNLRMARKRKARDAEQAEAQANRAKHGLGKTERHAAAADIERVIRALEGAKRDN
ncbi:DUF4169 family protein [Novosphingobium sp.]|uniref:DUF4169 family protein n=1 Tax=Novosphingobium sp. TaxID=1874826 RepID=UPI002B4A12F6|nr:DUF4169 family protein [Novosphingobium sp.]HKR93527.1 DUF4169 family protein [Novosphingobium sp.]